MRNIIITIFLLGSFSFSSSVIVQPDPVGVDMRELIPFIESVVCNIESKKVERYNTFIEDTADMIIKWEGFSYYPYKCPAGNLTIGYGTRVYNSELFITKENARNILIQTIIKLDRKILEKVNSPLTYDQRTSLISLVYNIGFHAFSGSSLFRNLSEGNYKSLSYNFRRWNKITVNREKIPLRGLTLRRAEEYSLFMRTL